ncbi:hypothetical protein GLAREA_05698 [Glarea lozoyensis ATCC 20868]|uniref:Uncharacterized protein n=2 Tax=Glarea lozoyensis TaxID=101852 RepID=S3DF42_GLAL2|nr:uncharacterized protein GLAREA_05698 [Glarea lozoyensis ATCC 20868]EHK98815.1 hypothetical protein M7I_5323 [Glarea lozoyensis 74030]EPE36360.1 hypothetical protein GLAREA_05698 [Glarea lozoyensis ATCC 20868]
MAHNISTGEVNRPGDAEARERFKNFIEKLSIEELQDEPIFCGKEILAFPTFLPNGTREALFVVSEQDLGNVVRDPHWHSIVVAETFPLFDDETLNHVPRMQILMPRGRRDMTAEEWQKFLLGAFDDYHGTPRRRTKLEWKDSQVIEKLGELEMGLEGELDMYGFRIEKELIEDGDRYIFSKLPVLGAPLEIVADFVTYKAQIAWIEIVYGLLQNLEQRQLGAGSAGSGLSDGN